MMERMNSIIDRLKQMHPDLAKYANMTEKERIESNVQAFNETEGDKHLLDGYNCDICRNKGFISVMRTRQDLRGNDIYEECLTECKCTKVRKSIMRMKRSGMEELFKKYKFENYTITEPWQKMIQEKAQNFANNPAPVFFIGGQSGTGKTHLCTAIARQLLFDGNELRYILWRDESVKLKSAVNNDEKYQSLISELKRVDVLYIDDFLKVPIGHDTSKPTSADLAVALEIINNRYNAKLITIISSEWTIKDIIEMDEALGGRIYEMAGAEYSANIGKDTKKNYRIKNIVEL